MTFLTKYKELILALLSSVVVFLSVAYWMFSFYDRSQKVTVVVAARDLVAPLNLAEADLKLVKVSRQILPASAVVNIEKVADVTLVQSMTTNEILTTNHLARDIAATADSLLVSFDQYGFSLPSAWLAAPPPKVSAGDKVTLIGSLPDQPANRGTAILMEHVIVLKVDNDKEGLPSRVLLDLNLSQAALIGQSKVNRLALILLVESYKTTP